MKIVLVLASFALTGFNVSAQESVVAVGGDGSSAGGSVAFSVGQPLYQATNQTTGAVYEGVQQPFEMFTLSDETQLLGVSIHVYPNPVTQELRIESSVVSDQMNWKLHDAAGRLIADGDVVAGSAFVDMQPFASSLYVLTILIDGKPVQTSQIIKN